MAAPNVILLWRIENFSFPRDKIIDSPQFDAGQTAWHLRLFSSGGKLGSSVKRSTEGPRNIIASFSLSIAKNDGSNEIIQTVTERNFLLDDSSTCDGSGLEADDFEGLTTYLDQRTLTILFQVRFCNIAVDQSVQYWATTRFGEDRLVQFDWEVKNWSNKKVHAKEILLSARCGKIKMELLKEHNLVHVELLNPEHWENWFVSISIRVQRESGRNRDSESLLEEETKHSIEDLKNENLTAKEMENFVTENVLNLQCHFSFISIIENRITKEIYGEE